jgi:hypothetical protein
LTKRWVFLLDRQYRGFELWQENRRIHPKIEVRDQLASR